MPLPSSLDFYMRGITLTSPTWQRPAQTPPLFVPPKGEAGEEKRDGASLPVVLMGRETSPAARLNKFPHGENSPKFRHSLGSREAEAVMS